MGKKPSPELGDRCHGRKNRGLDRNSTSESPRIVLSTVEKPFERPDDTTFPLEPSNLRPAHRLPLTAHPSPAARDAWPSSDLVETHPPGLGAVRRGVDLEIGEEPRRLTFQHLEDLHRHPPDLELRP